MYDLKVRVADGRGTFEEVEVLVQLTSTEASFEVPTEEAIIAVPPPPQLVQRPEVEIVASTAANDLTEPERHASTDQPEDARNVETGGITEEIGRETDAEEVLDIDTLLNVRTIIEKITVCCYTTCTC